MKNIFKIVPFLFLFGCAGYQRGCASTIATEFGGDWVIAQYRADGVPMNCWQLKNTSVSNEPSTDGIYWLESGSGHLVHISGWYNRVQVNNGDYATAAKLVGVELHSCKGGHYTAPKIETVEETVITN